MIGTKYIKGKRFEFRDPLTGFYQSLMMQPDRDAQIIQRALITKPAKLTWRQRLRIV